MWPKGGARRQQLEGETDAFAAELECAGERDPSSPCVDRACDLLEIAREEAQHGRIGPGYQALNAARRLMVDA